ncbi:MAG: hypothetical protein ACQ5SW_08400 [Sphaerochaetaceae bacterium]
MNIKDLIDSYIDDVRKNDYSTAAKISWCSDVDCEVRDKIMQQYVPATISIVADTAAYDLPDGVSFDSIEVVYQNGVEIPKLDARTYQKNGYFLNTSGQIELYPTPTAALTDGLRIIYQSSHTRYTTDDYDNNVTLLIPDQYATIYSEYIFSKMNYLDKQYEDYNNDVLVYNASMENFATWYNQKNPQSGRKIKNVW